jgi:hypothetical protein
MVIRSHSVARASTSISSIRWAPWSCRGYHVTGEGARPSLLPAKREIPPDLLARGISPRRGWQRRVFHIGRIRRNGRPVRRLQNGARIDIGQPLSQKPDPDVPAALLRAVEEEGLVMVLWNAGDRLRCHGEHHAECALVAWNGSARAAPIGKKMALQNCPAILVCQHPSNEDA